MATKKGPGQSPRRGTTTRPASRPDTAPKKNPPLTAPAKPTAPPKRSAGR